MVNYCRVVGCTNRSDRETDRQFYRLPAVVSNQGEETRKLSEERRRKWLAVLNQNFAEKNLDNIRVCSDHFISGKKSSLYPPDHPDWVPHVKVTASTSSATVRGRFNRRYERKRKIEQAKYDFILKQNETDAVEAHAEPMSGTTTSSQTDISGHNMDDIRSELRELKKENDQLRAEAKSSVKFDSDEFEGNDEKVKFFTGLPTFTVLMCVFSTLEKFLPSRSSLSKFRMLMLTLKEGEI